MKRIILFLFVFLSLFLFFNFAYARVLPPDCGGTSDCPERGEGLIPCGTTCCPCTFCDLFVMIEWIITYFVSYVAPVFAMLMIGIGAFMMITAYANPVGSGPEGINKAKALFKSIIIGLLIIYGSWLIVNTFFWFFLDPDKTWTEAMRQGGWAEIDCEIDPASVPGGALPPGGGGPGGGVPGGGVPANLCSINCTSCANKNDCNTVGTSCKWGWWSQKCIQHPCVTECSQCVEQDDCLNMGPNCKWTPGTGWTWGKCSPN